MNKLSDDMNADGLRVVGVCYKYLKKVPQELSVQSEKGMTFVGYIAFLDPPKESAEEAIAKLIAQGVEIKVLTGDSPLVCKRVCEQLKLPIKSIVTTKDLEGLDGEQLKKLAREGTIFARLTPFQKAEIVNALKNRGEKNLVTYKQEFRSFFRDVFCCCWLCMPEEEPREEHIVGFMGDGINDANALHDADVGISVNDAVDVAKEMSDIILLEKSLTVLAAGVRLGRITYGNTVKYIKMAVSSNFGNVFSVTYASAWLPFLPMLPLQLLLQNLLYDFSQLAIPWDKMDKDFIKVPRPWNWKSVLRFMLYIGPMSSCFDATTFSLMWFYYHIQDPKDPRVIMFQTAWFVEGLITQTLIVHMIRTRHIPFFQSIAAWPLLFSTSTIITAAIVIPFLPGVNTYLSMTPLPGLYYLYLIGANVSYALLVFIGKHIYIRVFGDWM